jgi:RNA polymerase sigma-70 factor (ECF subfamily)
MVLAGNPGIYAGTSMNNVEELLERACSGDEEAFGLIFERYASPVFSFIYRMVGQHELAEELTQETFVRAYRKMGGLQLRADVKLSTWLFSIAKNVSRESLRSRRKEDKKVEIGDRSILELSDDELQPDALLLNQELSHRIQDALGSLDEDKRLVFVLRVIHQHNYDEIAEITGFSLSKLKTDIFRARAEMKRLLRSYLEMGHEM